MCIPTSCIPHLNLLFVKNISIETLSIEFRTAHSLPFVFFKHFYWSNPPAAASAIAKFTMQSSLRPGVKWHHCASLVCHRFFAPGWYGWTESHKRWGTWQPAKFQTLKGERISMVSFFFLVKCSFSGGRSLPSSVVNNFVSPNCSTIFVAFLWGGEEFVAPIWFASSTTSTTLPRGWHTFEGMTVTSNVFLLLRLLRWLLIQSEVSRNKQSLLF